MQDNSMHKTQKEGKHTECNPPARSASRQARHQVRHHPTENILSNNSGVMGTTYDPLSVAARAPRAGDEGAARGELEQFGRGSVVGNAILRERA